MSKSDLFFGGVPTGPDIKALREAFPEEEMTPGDVIQYSIVEELLGVTVQTSRFRTVTTRWRKIVEKESKIILGVKPGVGFVVLSDSDKVDLSGAKIRSSFRSARRSFVVTGYVDTKNLSEHEVNRLDSLKRSAAAVLCAHQVKGVRNNLPSLEEGRK